MKTTKKLMKGLLANTANSVQPAADTTATSAPDTKPDIRPDEYAARRDALRAIAAMIPDTERELYSLMLAVREPGMLDRIHAYADHHQIGRSTVYFRIKKLAEAIQLHPWFDEITAPFRPIRQTA